jgi:hypothetical protein
MDVKTIVEDAIREGGAAGLCNDDCGCGMDDFAPCGDGPYPDCVLAQVRSLGDDERIGDAGPGDWIYTPLVSEPGRTVAAETAIRQCQPPGWWGDQMVGHTRSQAARRAYLHADPNGYAYEHTLVAVAALGRLLATNEAVHHRNGDKTDNRWENREVLTRGDDNREHNMTRRRDERGRFVEKRAAGRLLDGRTWDEYPASSTIDSDDDGRHRRGKRGSVKQRGRAARREDPQC